MLFSISKAVRPINLKVKNCLSHDGSSRIRQMAVWTNVIITNYEQTMQGKMRFVCFLPLYCITIWCPM